MREIKTSHLPHPLPSFPVFHFFFLVFLSLFFPPFLCRPSRFFWTRYIYAVGIFGIVVVCLFVVVCL